MAMRYQIGDFLKQMHAFVGVEPERVLRRAGLSAALAQNETLSVDAAAYFRICHVMAEEAKRPGIELELAIAYAHGPFVPAIFAFSCAETLNLGLSRLSDFKPLVGPMTMQVVRNDAGLSVTLRPTESHLTISASLGLFEVLYITECARTFTGVPIVPVETSIPGEYEIEDDIITYLGGRPTVSDAIRLTFSPQDADLPLITRSASLWDTLEPQFTKQLELQKGAATMSGRIKSALSEALPGGSTSIEDMARRLNVSKRSLQRRLGQEGTSYQALLNETRFEMSERYLQDSALSVPEISYMLGFRDTSSFFRAFQGWTGQTPGDYRTTVPPRP